MAFLHTNKLLTGDASRWLRRHQKLVVFGIAVVMTCLTYFASVSPKLESIPRLEEALIDLRFKLRLIQQQLEMKINLRKTPLASPNCVIIGISGSSLTPSNFPPEDVAKSEALQLMSQPYPWNRKVYALLLDKLMAAGAKVVAFDQLFLSNKEGDAEFAAALRKYGDRVVLGSTFDDQDQSTSQQQYCTPAPDLLTATPENITGCTKLPTDLDGVNRVTWYWTSQLRYMGYPDDSHEIISFAGLAARKFRPNVELRDGIHLINYQGPPATYPYLPLEDVFMDKMFNQSKQFDFGKVFQGKMVFVGSFAELLQDSHYTPFGLMPGVEIHAQIAASLLDGTPLRTLPGWVGIALIIAMGLTAALVSLRITHALALFGYLAAGIALFTTIAQCLFVGKSLVIPMASPLVAFAGTGLFELVFNFLIEQMKGARVRTVLDRLVSKNVAELVLAEGDQFEKSLKGQRRPVSTLFSDIRGFTTLTEEAAVPENLVDQLNEYFQKMVNEVVATDGTLQQFVGDAIMAVWGNTHTLEPAVGAQRAVKTALEMRSRLAELNATWANNPARHPFHIGIGVNHGEVIVGLVGHPQRMEYTGIGDGINTAARLETATKQFGCTILVGEAVEQLTREQFIYRQVGTVKFKGKKKAIEVFTPLTDAATPAPDWLAAYHHAMELYRKREFQKAHAAFEEVKARLGNEDWLCDMYLVRCTDFIANPPGADWDGAWSLTEK